MSYLMWHHPLNNGLHLKKKKKPSQTTFAFHSHLDCILVHIRENTQGSPNFSSVAQVWNAAVNRCQHGRSHLFSARIAYIWGNMLLCWTFFFFWNLRTGSESCVVFTVEKSYICWSFEPVDITAPTTSFVHSMHLVFIKDYSCRWIGITQSIILCWGVEFQEHV